MGTTRTMNRLELQVELNYDILEPGADFIFNIHAAQTSNQVLTGERLMVNQAVPLQMHTDAASGNRYLRLHADPGVLQVSYAVTVDLSHHWADPAVLQEVPIPMLPLEVMGYVYPSRYCQSDRLMNLARAQFGHLNPGYARVMAIRDWVFGHVTFKWNTSNSTTSAIDTLVDRVGVCRDFAHLMIALCRALNIPARFATGTDFGSDPSLGPPNFQAYVEVYLSGRWYIFDPSGTVIPMGLVRFGTGRDAADVAFATIFGSVRSRAPIVRSFALEDTARNIVMPQFCDQALSTDSASSLTC
jgi:transglutaminase-like putative cysteine protease